MKGRVGRYLFGALCSMVLIALPCLAQDKVGIDGIFLGESESKALKRLRSLGCAPGVEFSWSNSSTDQAFYFSAGTRCLISAEGQEFTIAGRVLARCGQLYVKHRPGLVKAMGSPILEVERGTKFKIGRGYEQILSISCEKGRISRIAIDQVYVPGFP